MMQKVMGSRIILLIALVSVGVFFLVPFVPIVVPCAKGGDGTIGQRFEGWESPSYALFSIGVSTGPPIDCYIP